jgi:hypothetical protein
MQEYKVLGYIDLPPKPEKFSDKIKPLKEFIRTISAETNRDLKTELLDDSGRIKMGNYVIPDAPEENFYNPAAVAADQRFIADREKSWSEKEGLSLEAWRSKQEKRPSAALELMLSAVFYKFLKGDFVIARTAPFDDYYNHGSQKGIDHLIVNRQTGKAFCAFDDAEVKPTDPRSTEKQFKMIAAAKSGGAFVRYGVTFKPGQEGKQELVRKPLSHLPVFCLGVSQEEGDQLLKGMSYDPDEISPVEAKIFLKLLDSLEAQAETLKKQTELSENFLKNLESFLNSLQAMKTAALAKLQNHES